MSGRLAFGNAAYVHTQLVKTPPVLSPKVLVVLGVHFAVIVVLVTDKVPHL